MLQSYEVVGWYGTLGSHIRVQNTVITGTFKYYPRSVASWRGRNRACRCPGFSMKRFLYLLFARAGSMVSSTKRVNPVSPKWFIPAGALGAPDRVVYCEL